MEEEEEGGMRGRQAIKKDTQPSQTCSGGNITPNRPKIDAGDASLLMGSIN